MSTGAVLVAIAVTAILVAYISEPFRRRPGTAGSTVEGWIAQARAAQGAATQPPLREPTPAAPPPAKEPGTAQGDAVNFCPQCGRRVAPDHQFCPGCGHRLQG